MNQNHERSNAGNGAYGRCEGASLISLPFAYFFIVVELDLDFILVLLFQNINQEDFCVPNQATKIFKDHCTYCFRTPYFEGKELSICQN